MTDRNIQATAEDLLPIGAAAAILGVNVRTIKRYVASGVLIPAVILPSRHTRFRRGDVDALRQPKAG